MFLFLCKFFYIVNDINVCGFDFFEDINPLSPHDALKHHFTSLKTHLISLQPRILKTKISMKPFYKYMAIFFNFHPHQIIFIHYKSRIATAIRGL